MRIETRHVLDRSFSGLGLVSVFLLFVALVVLLAPIVWRGSKAFVFRGTIEHRRLTLVEFDRGNAEALAEEQAQADGSRGRLYAMMAEFEEELDTLSGSKKRSLERDFRQFRKDVAQLLGPAPGEPEPVLVRQQYGETRWDRALIALDKALVEEKYDTSDPTKLGVKVRVPRVERYEGTKLEPAFAYLEENAERMMRPRLTFYWRFLTDESIDAHFFGGVWPELLGTLYLTLGAMLFAVPLGVISAIYLTQYAKQGPHITLLRTCVNTLAGVPSIVFGLFGLAFFINTLHVCESKSVLAGSLTLAVLVLPTVIRASEEAILAVPRSYVEAALSLGAGQWKTIMRVILPAALPGILTGIVISMGRAAGETAPIIFTAAVSVGKPLSVMQSLSNPTPALPWNIYNLATEHEAVDQIRHVQYGMVLVLVALVLALNAAAILLRARISRKLKA